MPRSNKHFWLRVWLCFFGYGVLTSVLIQFVFLPFVCPSWHAGHGLMKGHDWVTYHLIGVELSKYIHDGEWVKWWNADAMWIEPRAISLVYGLLVPEPWTLIPFNAFFHATAALILCFIFLGFVSNNRWAALWGALPFLLFPSALLWISQIHKDGATNFAFACYLYGWVLLFRNAHVLNWKRLASSLFLIGFGSWFAWVLRPYLGTVLTACSLIFFGVGLLFYFFQRDFKKLSNQKFGASLGASLLITLVLYPYLSRNSFTGIEVPSPKVLLQSDMFENIQREESFSSEAETVSTETEKEELSLNENASLVSPPAVASSSIPSEQVSIQPLQPMTKKMGKKRRPTPRNQIAAAPLPHKRDWEKTPFVPSFVEDKAYAMANVRNGFLGTQLGRSNTDKDVHFWSVLDVAKYVPRSMQLAVLAPFPSDWLHSGSTEYNSIFKKIVIGEMIVVYLMIPFFLLFLVNNYKRRDTLVVLLFSLSVLVLFGITVANLGTLYRFRYFFLMTWVGVGMSYAAALRFPQLFLQRVKTA